MAWVMAEHDKLPRRPKMVPHSTCLSDKIIEALTSSSEAAQLPPSDSTSRPASTASKSTKVQLPPFLRSCGSSLGMHIAGTLSHASDCRYRFWLPSHIACHAVTEPFGPKMVQRGCITHAGAGHCLRCKVAAHVDSVCSSGTLVMTL